MQLITCKNLIAGALFSFGVTMTQASPMPAMFTSASKVAQNRICGELLIGLAISGVRGLTGAQTADQDARRKMSLTMAAEAGLFFARSPNMDAKEKAESSVTTRKIEALAPADHFAVVTHCTKTVDEEFKKGAITPVEAAQAMEAINMLITHEQQRKPR